MPRSSASKVRKAKAQGKLGGCVVLLFFLIFALAGTAMAYWLSWKPWSNLVAAQSWVSVPCIILTSEEGRRAIGPDLEELFEIHCGNVRECLRHLYDRWGSGF